MFKYIVISSVFLVLIGFQNCSNDVNFADRVIPSTNQDNGGQDQDIGGQNLDIALIEDFCATKPQTTATALIQFGKPQNTCEWGQNGNLDPKDTFFQARIEQQQFLNLPEGAIICGAQFSFAQQQFQYDDYFALLFNRSVISAGYDFSEALESKKYGLLEYDWQNLVGIDMEFGSEKEQIFCPQIPGASSYCQFPPHDVPGTIELEFDDKFIQSLMSNGVPENHSFTMVTFGDNDELDCEHSDIEFTVQVQYVQ